MKTSDAPDGAGGSVPKCKCHGKPMKWQEHKGRKGYWRCPTRTLEAQRRYREANRVRVAAVQKKWREKNRNEQQAYQLRYREENREAIRAAAKRWRLAHEEELKEGRRRYYWANRETLRAKKNQWHSENYEKVWRYYIEVRRPKELLAQRGIILAKLEELENA